MMSQTSLERSQIGQRAYSLPASASAFHNYHPPKELLRQTPLNLPELSELDLTRQFCGLAKKNAGIDTVFYPLGSCTMKLNPRINEKAAGLSSFTNTHPLAPDETVQGNLQIIEELGSLLCDITGMKAATLVSNAGAQGEFIGALMIAAYHQKRGDSQRIEMLIPDNAHGTNPATAAMAGMKTVTIRTNASGDMNLDHLRSLVSERTAGLMLTNPNTLGLFSSDIKEISRIIHQAGGLLYYDGANLNSILNIAKPADMGFDVMHINLHKTFSTPHGGGGPGSGPVLCNQKLESFLPIPRVQKSKKGYNVVWNEEDSIGQISSFHGNFGIYLRAYLYIKLHGMFGLRKVSEIAVLNANYLKNKLSKLFTVPFPQHCMHEFVLQADRYVDQGIRALDIAKRLLDYGVYAPTIYFPLIVKECMLIEPTETESKRTLDEFVMIFEKICHEIENNPSIVKEAPHTMSVTRLDEVAAAKNPVLHW